MNRSLQAFAVLLVSLAGSMVAIVWSPAGTGPKSTLAVQNGPVASPTLSTNSQKNSRKNEGLSSVLVVRPKTIPVPAYEDSCGYDQVTGRHYLAVDCAASNSLIARQNESYQAEYAAAERAAAGLVPADETAHTNAVLSSFAKFSLQTVRNVTSRQRVTELQMLAESFQLATEESLQRTGMTRMYHSYLAREEHLRNRPALPGDWEMAVWLPVSESEGQPVVAKQASRQLLSLTAKALESLAGVLQHTASDLHRLAMQDVAKLHTAAQPQDAKR